jgi:CRISPR-associated protein Cas1
MDLVISTRGASIKKIDERFQVSVEGNKQEFSSKKIERILITTSVMVTTDALKLAVENNIDVVFLEQNGMPYARVWHSKLGSISTIRRNQLKLNEIPLGTEFVKEWIIQKIENQVHNLTKLKLNRSDEKILMIDAGIEKIEKYIKELGIFQNKPIDILRGTIEGYEGQAAKIYFKILGSLIPEKYFFDGRSRNPAQDQFNCLLNYSYGILYSNVEKALVFDLIEMYRGYMDYIVFTLFSKRKVRLDMFEEVVGGGYWLNKSGKQLLIETVNEKFEDKIKYKGRMIKLKNIIQFDCHNIANRILKEVE